jgi:hypothetical protein
MRVDEAGRIVVKRQLVVVAFSILLTVSSCSADVAVYEQFRAYRMAIAKDQRSCFDFFSRRFLEEWLDTLLYADDASAIKHMDIVWDEFLSGAVVEVVHGYEVERTGVNEFLLTIEYSNRITNELKRIGFRYVTDNGKLLIDGIDLYALTFGSVPPTKIEDFSGLYIPERHELIDSP